MGFLACAVLALPALCGEADFIINVKDHHFVPAEVHIPAGRKVRVIIQNDGDGAEEFDSHSLNREKHIPAHSSVVLFLGPLDAGRYIFEGENDVARGAAALGVIVAE
jgi:hypothetical protein